MDSCPTYPPTSPSKGISSFLPPQPATLGAHTRTHLSAAGDVSGGGGGRISSLPLLVLLSCVEGARCAVRVCVSSLLLLLAPGRVGNESTHQPRFGSVRSLQGGGCLEGEWGAQ
jgi:hypothetical protein